MSDRFAEMTSYLPLIRAKDKSAVAGLEHAICEFVDRNPDYELDDYERILQEHALEWGGDSMKDADVSDMDAQGVMALLVGALRAERFSEGVLLVFLKYGCIERWLERLQQIEKGY